MCTNEGERERMATNGKRRRRGIRSFRDTRHFFVKETREEKVEFSTVYYNKD